VALNDLVILFEDQVAAIAIYSNGGEPPFFNQTAYKKIRQYHPPYLSGGSWQFGTPWLWCDGDKDATGKTSTWSAFIGERLLIPSNLDIQIVGFYNALNSTLALQFRVRNTGANSIAGRMHAVLVENGIRWNASNGQQIHNHVPRIWWPDYLGRSVRFPSGGITTISTNWSVDKAWNAAALEIVAFVQDTIMQTDFTYEIFQGAIQKVADIQMGIETDGVEAARIFQLFQNTPNPFNPSTKIPFQLPAQNRVVISIFDVRGGKIRTVFEGTMPAGSHSIAWDGNDENGLPAPSGIYIVTVKANRIVRSIKMTLMR
jgi:hypothetical protein